MLVVNPIATATTQHGRDLLVRALGGQLAVDVVETGARGDATVFAKRAIAESVDLIVALGGDGTVNEIINGLLTDGPRPDLPAVTAVPGGSGNVFVRALGLSRDPTSATSEILDALRSGRTRRIGLGRARIGPAATERWFTFAAGLGLDAEVVRRVDERRAGGPAPTSLYVTTTVRQFFHGTPRRHPRLRVVRPGRPDIDGVYLAVVSNTAPWTYAGRLPLNPSPAASFDSGLDLFAMTSMSTPSVLRAVGSALRRRPRMRGRRQVGLHDEPELTVSSSEPIAVQVDGEYIGEYQTATFSAVPGALRVIA